MSEVKAQPVISSRKLPHDPHISWISKPHTIIAGILCGIVLIYTAYFRSPTLSSQENAKAYIQNILL